MSRSIEGAARGGISLCGAMFLVLLTLKLCGAIDWSWWLVTAPLWAPAVALAGLVLAFIVVVVVLSLFDTD